ncbi:N-acetyltransferase [Pseudoalteromonas sp. J010]|uniref:GNAT family N-acetyltransferase n=1 Tax=Pseudoalteromonas sp. J010 TaxID=998465 RepID=UPI000F646D0C|nr:GNAT family N-acetyltransferase [Pseudoalteromonas sp. J010]RRS09373.1 N-acetyltransferase [Pseudoalteromonas sp. J010]
MYYFQIRPARPCDAASLAALSIQVWLDTYALEGVKQEYADYALTTFTQAYFLALLQRDEISIYVAEHDGAIQGYIQANRSSQYGDQDLGFEIEKLYVLRRWHGKGAGSQLITAACADLGEKYWLYTWVENESNQFYQKLGLAHCGQFDFSFNGKVIANHVYTSRID